jgi:hypothetical protein
MNTKFAKINFRAFGELQLPFQLQTHQAFCRHPDFLAIWVTANANA